jgi:hypothetical protein
MSVKIAAEHVPKLVAVREYDDERDKVAVEELERRSEEGQKGKHALVTDQMGDPICRVRPFPIHIMLVIIYLFHF